MTAETQRLVIAAVLLLHGLAHLVALGALVAILVGVRSPTGPVPRLWAPPRVSTPAGALVGAILWALATAGFLAAAAAFWGLGLSALEEVEDADVHAALCGRVRGRVQGRDLRSGRRSRSEPRTT